MTQSGVREAGGPRYDGTPNRPRPIFFNELSPRQPHAGRKVHAYVHDPIGGWGRGDIPPPTLNVVIPHYDTHNGPCYII